jgi:anti-anti-sigma factor
MKFALSGLKDGVAQIQISGRVSQEEISPFGDIFRDHLGAEAYGQRVVVDMSDIDWLDSSGVSWFLSSHKKFKQAGGRLVLHSPSPMVHDIFKVLHLHKILQIAPNLPAAEALLREEPS